MVPKITRLQLHFTAYTWKDEHKGRYSIKKDQVDTREDNKDVQMLKEEL